MTNLSSQQWSTFRPSFSTPTSDDQPQKHPDMVVWRDLFAWSTTIEWSSLKSINKRRLCRLLPIKSEWKSVIQATLDTTWSLTRAASLNAPYALLVRYHREPRVGEGQHDNRANDFNSMHIQRLFHNSVYLLQFFESLSTVIRAPRR